MRNDYLEQSVGDSQTLIIAFTSFGGDGRPADNFEWVGTVARMGVSGLFFRDTAQHWYHGPVRGFSVSMRDSIERIKTLIARHKIKRTITLGSSMGGHGALLYGAMLQADYSVVFAPQVNMDAAWREANGDGRWSLKASEMNFADYEHLSLSALLDLKSPRHIALFYDAAVQLDQRHAGVIAHLPQAYVKNVGIGEHTVAQAMSQAGVISEILEDRILRAEPYT